MTRGQHKRVSSHNAEHATMLAEQIQVQSPDVNKGRRGLGMPGPSEETQALSTTVLRLLALAQRMAARVSAGKYGLALENDARAVLELWDALPEELK